jgi:hypothetical protein
MLLGNHEIIYEIEHHICFTQDLEACGKVYARLPSIKMNCLKSAFFAPAGKLKMMQENSGDWGNNMYNICKTC